MSNDLTNIQSLIAEECDLLKSMLLAKNAAYGNSAANPVRVFAKGIDDEAGIMVRMDDKLSRIARGSDAGEDPMLDLAGYIVLLRAIRKLKQRGLKQMVSIPEDMPPTNSEINKSPDGKPEPEDSLSFLVDTLLHAALGHGNDYEFLRRYYRHEIRAHVHYKIQQAFDGTNPAESSRQLFNVLHDGPRR
jgi:hypothetical protein